jgi:hypothetical protein
MADLNVALIGLLGVMAGGYFNNWTAAISKSGRVNCRRSLATIFRSRNQYIFG